MGYSDPYGLCAQGGGDTTKIEVCRQPLPNGGVEDESLDLFLNLYPLGKVAGPILGRLGGALRGLLGSRVAAMSDEGAALLGATPVGSALKADAEHLGATFMRGEAAERGTHFAIVGKDKQTRTLTQYLGEMNGRTGRFEYIVDASGNLTHQRFVRGGTINGIPNTP